MHFQDYWDDDVTHVLKFKEFKNFKTEFNYGNNYANDSWNYCEILPVDEKFLSIEIYLSSGTAIYLEFDKLQYKKVVKKSQSKPISE